MNNQLMLEAVSVFGLIKYYPTGEIGQAVCRLTGKKTVDLMDVRSLETLGFDVRVLGRAEMPACEVIGC